jgi:hypothetical protein
MGLLRIGAYGLAALLKRFAKGQVAFADMLRLAADRLERWADRGRSAP